MTNEQINAAIAEACGWSMEDGVWVWTADGIDCTYYELWDWANDLNAMHEAEKVLTDAQCVFFRTYLREQLGPHPASLYVWHATARQRAEAFLRVLGKWEEVQP
jgi:hypothetical protein